MSQEMNNPTKVVKGIEVVLMPSNHPWTDCSKCPFAIQEAGLCSIASEEDYCPPGMLYIDPDKLALARLKGEV